MCPQPIKKNGPFQKPRSKTVKKKRKSLTINDKKIKEEDGNLKT